MEYDWLIKKPQKVNMADNSENAERIKFFDLDIDDLQWHGRNFSVMEMWPCTRQVSLGFFFLTIKHLLTHLIFISNHTITLIDFVCLISWV